MDISITLRKACLLTLLVVLIGLFFGWDLHHLFTLDYLKSQHLKWMAAYQQNPIVSLSLYFLVYVLMTALSLPGAGALTLMGGAIFGFFWTTLVVSFASTMGATFAFLMARTLFQGKIRAKFSKSFKAIHRGFSQEGGFYLFALRVIPIFPFFLINIGMGLTPIRVRLFYWVSQLGMLPGTLVYVYAGTQIGQVDSVDDIFSFKLLSAFALLGIFPILAKRVIAYIRNKRLYASFKRPKCFDYNLVVIGAGAGGLVSAYMASALQAKVALVECHKMGGDCLNYGCVPSKALIKISRIIHEAHHAHSLGISVKASSIDFECIMQRIRDVIRRIEPNDSIERYGQLGVDCFQAHAKVIDPYRVQIGPQIVSTRSIIIATGATPIIPSLPGIEHIVPLTSETVWDLKSLPKRLLVLGGGPMGCELGQCFARLGSQVTLVERRASIIPGSDPQAIELLTYQLVKEQIRVCVHHEALRVIRLKERSQQWALVCLHEGKEVVIEFDQILCALGRRPRVKGFGLEDLNLEVNSRGYIAHTDDLRSRFPNIWVCGDVSGPIQLTHVAGEQGVIASLNALFSPFKTFTFSKTCIPSLLFTDPQVAQVGLTETQAIAQKIAYEVHLIYLDEIDRAVIEDDLKGFIKILTQGKTDKIMGATIVGGQVGELLSEITLAMRHRLGLRHILSTLHPYPSYSEGNKKLAGHWKATRTPNWVYTFMRRFHQWRR